MKMNLAFAALVVAAVTSSSISANAQQQPLPASGYIQLTFGSVAFIGVCGSTQQPVRGSVGLNYTSLQDANDQLRALYPQCLFQQIQISPLPLPAAPPAR